MNIMHRLCDRPDWIAPTRQTYQRLERGAEWADGAPVAIDRRTALACAAIATAPLRVELPDGAQIPARGAATLGERVFVRDGAIEGPAPTLPVELIEV